MDLIDRIRRENGCDQALLGRAKDDLEISAAIEALKGNASRGLERLSDELYSRDTHFLLEFLQNADDNHYPPGIVPQLRVALSLEEMQIKIECNERGFDESNVEAICRIGASTKRTATGYIGEKGIGFKSVFKVADVVYISSGLYTFKLDRREELGMITPIWAPDSPATPGLTTFILKLRKSAGAAAISAHLNDIRPSLLLFLRKLCCVITQGPVGIVEIHKEDVDQDVVLLKRIENGVVATEKYLRVTRSTKTYDGESKRAHITESDIVLAFPLEDNESPKIGVQDVHAFLPLRPYGFPFVIQGDFLTSTSREDILADLKWNIALRDAIPGAFLAALDKFKSRSVLKYTWIRFLPHDIVDSFFYPVQSAIFAELIQRPVLCMTDGTYDLPSKFIIATKPYCTLEGVPIVPEAYLPDGLHYLPSIYDESADSEHLARLGVLQMSADHFLRSLHLMQGHFPSQTTVWHEAVCQSLYLIPRLRNGGLRMEIQHLMLLPLSDNTWVSGLSSTDVFFQSTLSDIPADLGLRLIANHIPPNSWTYRLYAQLGIRESDSQRVANKILDLHRRSYSMPLRTLISHAGFMFIHRHSKVFPSAAGLRLADEEERVGFGHELYADFLSAQQSIGMRGVLPSPARFIHPTYLLENGNDEWKKWLCDSVGVNTSPRLVHGQPSPEFNAMAQATGTQALLTILKESWPKWSSKLTTSAYTKLSDILVTSADGSKLKIKETYLKKKTMVNYSALPYLPIDDPDSYEWGFLSKLGVTTQVNGPFFLKRIRDFKISLNPEPAKAEEIYQQLQARFEDDMTSIRNAFRQEALIFVPINGTPGRWVSTADAVWDGPPSVKSKCVLKPLYPSLQKFFLTQLALPVVGPDMLVQELLALVSQHSGKPILPPVQTQVYEYLVDISDIIWAYPGKAATCLAKLSKERIFPVANTQDETILLSADEHFYIPDLSGRYQAVFSNHVPILRTDGKPSLEGIRPILESDTFKTRLRNLGTFTTHVCLPAGSRQFESGISAKYARVADYIERLWNGDRRTKITPQALQILDQLRGIRIHIVDSIESTFTLDGITVADQEALAIEQLPEELCVLISKAGLSVSPDLAICGRLAEIIGIDVHTLFNFASHPPETIEQLMRIQNIPELAFSTRGRKDHTAPALADSHSSDHDLAPTVLDGAKTHPDLDQSQLVNELKLILNKDTSSIRSAPVMAASIGNQPAPSADSTRLVGTIDASAYVAMASEKTSISAANNHPPIPIAAIGYPAVPTTTLGLADVGEAALDVPAVQPAIALTQKMVADDRSPTFQITGEQVLTGFLGESFMYSEFLKELPEFGPENWTSEWRANYPGMEPYIGPSLADFVYPDHQGVLTSFIYGEETKTAWTSAWPTYHMEVKSTAGSQSESFHLSRTQMDHALHLTYRPSAESVPPKELYVIVRVSKVRTSAPAYWLYCDPHRLFYEGGIRVASGIEATRGPVQVVEPLE